MESCQSLSCLSLQGSKAELGLINLISTEDEGEQYFCHAIKACHETNQSILTLHFLFLHPTACSEQLSFSFSLSREQN